MIGREDEVRGYRDRAQLAFYMVLLAFSLIVARLVYLQILKGDDLRKFSEANRLKKEKLLPTRGVIFDRDGQVIVDNRAAFDVVMLSQYYPFKPEMNARLARALQVPLPELEKKLARAKKTASYYPILLRADVSKEIIAAIEMDAEGFPGVDVEATVQRRYPFREIAAQLLGYISEVDNRDLQKETGKHLEPGDFIGRMGLERQYDAFLRGIDGVGYVEVDAMGRRRKTEGAEKLLGFVTQTEPFPGNNMYLTLDADVQVAAANALKSRSYSGSVVAIDPRNGEIIAWVNSPSFEPEAISGRGTDPKVWQELSTNSDRPLRNRAIQDIYPPGSTFKLFMAIAGLAEGAVNTSSAFHCSGGMHFGNRRFNCWKTHGSADFVRSIKESCDVFYYNLGLKIGIDKIAYYAREFGLGARTGIKLGSEQQGLIPDEAWKRKRFNDKWHEGETLSVAIGQGYVSVTPLQLANAYAAIASEGFLYRPQIIRRIEGRGGELIKEFQPELIRKVNVPAEVFKPIKEGLFQVVNVPGGTAYLSQSKYTEISGKTGTAQTRAFADIMKVKCESMPRDYRHHGWFVGYAPRDNPQIAVAALGEHACHGSSAGPMVREVIEAYLRKQALREGREFVVMKKHERPVAAKAATTPAPATTRAGEDE